MCFVKIGNKPTKLDPSEARGFLCRFLSMTKTILTYLCLLCAGVMTKKTTEHPPSSKDTKLIAIIRYSVGGNTNPLGQTNPLFGHNYDEKGSDGLRPR